MDLSFLNSEWYREELSPLEATLRFPALAKQTLYLLAQRLILPTATFGALAFLTLKKLGLNPILNFPLWLIFLTLLFIFEHLKTGKWWQDKVLPKHLENVEIIKNLNKNPHTLKDLLMAIQESVNLSSWGMVRTAYYGFHTYSWEYVLKAVYSFCVRRELADYKILLIGFPNKVTEGDNKLWEIAQEKNWEKRQRLLNEYLDEFGSKVIDVDLRQPTLREQPQIIEKLLNLYKSLPGKPEGSVKAAAIKRRVYEKKVLNNLRFYFLKPIFMFILRHAQANIRQRENRRYYEFLADYYIRRLILRLAERLKLKEVKEIFNFKWTDIKGKAKICERKF